MRENPSSYEIPQAIQERLLTTKKFSSAVGDILSGFRGELRRKVSLFYHPNTHFQLNII
jgi:hypothetical protein